MTKIIIPTWQNYDDYSQCVMSLIQLTRGSYKIVCINNANNKDVTEFNKKFGDIEEIKNELNLGFVKAVNQGLKTIGDEDIVLLNDDTIITDPYWLQNLQHLAYNNNELGAVAPMSNLVIGQQNVFFNYRNIDSYFKPKLVPKFLIFFCIFIKNAAFRQVGFLDERFGLGGNDDLDYSIRLRKAGWQLAVDTITFVYHKGARSILRAYGGYKKAEELTRPLLIEKWGKEEVDSLFTELRQQSLGK